MKLTPEKLEPFYDLRSIYFCCKRQEIEITIKNLEFDEAVASNVAFIVEKTFMGNFTNMEKKNKGLEL